MPPLMRRAPSGPPRPARRRRRASGRRTAPANERAGATPMARATSCCAVATADDRRLVGVDDARAGPPHGPSAARRARSAARARRARASLPAARLQALPRCRPAAIAAHCCSTESWRAPAGRAARRSGRARGRPAAPRARSRARGTSRRAPPGRRSPRRRAWRGRGSTASSTAWRASPRPTPAPRCSGVDDQADLADVAGPAVQRARRPRSRRPRRRRRRSTRAAPGRTHAATHVGVADVLLEERAVGIRDRGEEALERAPVAGLRSAGCSITAPSGRGVRRCGR